MECELLFRNGCIVDGTGNKRFRGNVAVDRGKIVAVGDTEGIQAAATFEAEGLVLAPGFIDVHVHSEKELVGGNDCWAGIEMGVTTQLSAPDGFGWSGLGGSRREEMRQYLEVFYGDTPAGWGGANAEEYLASFAGQLPGHLAFQAPHGAIRAAVMGWSAETADEKQLEAMKQLVKDWMDAGAVAFCTGLDYQPTVHSDLRELVELSRVAREYDALYVAHQRSDQSVIPHGTAETIEIGRQSGIKVHISHFTMDDEQEPLIRGAEAEGVDLSFDMYPYAAGCTHLLYYLPLWAQSGSPEQVKERLADKRDRGKMAEHLHRAFPPERLRCAAVEAPAYRPYVGMMLSDIAAETGMPIADLVCDMLLQSNLKAMFLYHWPEEREKFLKPTYQHPRHMVSTDGIYVDGLPHPRGYGSYPKILGSWVREQGWLSLEQAVRKMSGYPAERFGLRHRGKIMEGYVADLVVFDPENIHSPATFAEPRKKPEGIIHVLVDGVFVLKHGSITGALPGKVLVK